MKRLFILMLLVFPVYAQMGAIRSTIIRTNDAHSYAGDTFRTCTATANQRIITYNDGNASGVSHNVALAKLTLGANAAGTSLTDIEVTSDYGTSGQQNTNGWTDTSSWKSGGCTYINGVFYWVVFRQCNNVGGCGAGIANSGAHDVSIVASDDVTATPAHLVNPKTYVDNGNTYPHNATTAAGDPPTGPAGAATMWAGASHMGYMQFIQFNTGDTTDNNANYIYTISIDSAFANGYYISRAPVASILDVTTWSYYVGPIGGDVLNPDNWSASTTNHTLISTVSVASEWAGAMATMVHAQSPWNTYVMATSWFDSGTGGSQIHTKLLQAKNMTGPFAPFLTDPITCNQNFQQVITDTITATDAANGLGYMWVASGGSFDNSCGAGDYSPYFTKYLISFNSNLYGPRLSSPGTAIQTNSNIRLSYGNSSSSIPRRGLQQLWLMFDQAPIKSTPTIWPFQGSTEFFSGITCTLNSAILSTAGLSFGGTSGNRCETSVNAPSFLRGDGTYTIWGVANRADNTNGIITATGAAANGQLLSASFSANATGDITIGVYAGVIAYSAGSVASTNNWYFFAVTRRATGAVSTAADSALYLGGNRIVATYGARVPNIGTSTLTFGIRTNSPGYIGPLKGGIMLMGFHNVVLNPVEIRHIYEAVKRVATARGVTLQ